MNEEMNTERCEQVRMAALALADGEDPEIPRAGIEEHIGSCDRCRREVAALVELSGTLMAARRSADQADLWPLVQRRIGAVHAGAPLELPWLLGGVLLFPCWKVLELLLPAVPSPAFRFIPLLMAVALFLYLKSNPFKIDSGLRLEGE